MSLFVDSSVILDVLTDDPSWARWSEKQLDDHSREHDLLINDLVWSECSAAYHRIEDFKAVISGMGFVHAPMPPEALFLAAKAYLQYRRAGGVRTSPLPDFFIGAHAAVLRLPLLTRDPRRIRHHFPTVRLVTPD